MNNVAKQFPSSWWKSGISGIEEHSVLLLSGKLISELDRLHALFVSATQKVPLQLINNRVLIEADSEIEKSHRGFGWQAIAIAWVTTDASQFSTTFFKKETGTFSLANFKRITRKRPVVTREHVMPRFFPMALELKLA